MIPTITKSVSVFSVDILPMEELEGTQFIQGNFLHKSTQAKISEVLGNKKVNVILSDMVI